MSRNYLNERLGSGGSVDRELFGNVGSGNSNGRVGRGFISGGSTNKTCDKNNNTQKTHLDEWQDSKKDFKLKTFMFTDVFNSKLSRKNGIAHLFQYMGLCIFGSIVHAIYGSCEADVIRVCGDMHIFFRCLRLCEIHLGVAVQCINRQTFIMYEKSGNLVTKIDYIESIDDVQHQSVKEMTLVLCRGVLSILSKEDNAF